MDDSICRARAILGTILLGLILTGCASAPTPDNRAEARWMPQQEELETAREQCVPGRPAQMDPALDHVPATDLRREGDMLGPGDRLRIQVVGDDGRLSRAYVIDDYDRLELPGLAPLDTRGKTLRQVETTLAERLVEAGLVRPLPRVVDVSLMESAGLSVPVSGAVFQAGTVRIGERARETLVGQREGPASGDANSERSVAAAIRAAGGARPDADLTRIRVVRGQRWTELDLSGLLDGTRLGDVRLSPGDRVIVPSTACFDERLVRPSPLTPPGIRVYLSNLSRPAASNANSAIGKESSSLPYGTRLLQGLASANCIGGSAMNAHRQAVLISANPLNGRSVVIQRDIEGMLEHAQRDRINPYLMPNDAIACYDSRAMNARDAIALFGEALGSAATAILIDDLAQ
ncbi:Polysaccharide biosynthesis/export protein [Halomonas sp. THAF12]|uniref:polysaccharide biosynthesis/export family protein n=1 Tax=Halomonas sp. THAF12 TaxID=2587849 RepID=UPI001268E131|nr:polysaccharide biosynthesis/export family protein [Halomonas sp. THAF12]QFT84612.1 Polysaccharide biosynthesis/export protein [Halomonas sp. THAF12]